MDILTTILILAITLIPYIFKGVEKYISDGSKENGPVLRQYVIPEGESCDEQGDRTIKEVRESVSAEKIADCDIPHKRPEEVSESKAKKDKIDLIKLIIYSEIMKPKY